MLENGHLHGDGRADCRQSFLAEEEREFTSQCSCESRLPVG